MNILAQQIRAWAFIIGTLGFLPASSAQEMHLNPGLWELKTSMTSLDKPDMSAQMSQLQEAIRNMPPEARRMLEQKMGAHGLGFGDSGEIRVCFTEEQARSDQFYPGKSGKMGEDCTYSDVVKTGNAVKGRMSCVNPQMTGDFQALINPTRYTSEANVVAAESGRLQMKTEARWLGKDCGNIKPSPDARR
jgi:hypothetical protein